LRRDDYARGILSVLGQLTVVGDVTQASFEAQYDWMFPQRADTYYIVVAVDRALDKIVGSATMMFERKFIRSTGLVSSHEAKHIVRTCRRRGGRLRLQGQKPRSEAH
jgi:glucosamine-phosphate N-acetyltransferase